MLSGASQAPAPGFTTNSTSRRAYLPRTRRFCFLMASTSSDLFIVDLPCTSRRRATSSRCFLLALASTPSAERPVLFGPPPLARSSEGPFFVFGSQ